MHSWFTLALLARVSAVTWQAVLHGSLLLHKCWMVDWAVSLQVTYLVDGMCWLAGLGHCRYPISAENLVAVFGVLAGLGGIYWLCLEAWLAWVTAGPIHGIGTCWLCLA